MYYGWNVTNIICMKCVKGNYIRNDYICCSCGNGSISTEDNSKQCQECPQKYGANEDTVVCSGVFSYFYLKSFFLQKESSTIFTKRITFFERIFCYS